MSNPKQSAVRCPSCNESFTKKDGELLNRHHGLCTYCYEYLREPIGGYRYTERGDFDDWLARLWTGDSMVRPGVVNLTGDFWWNE